MILKGRSARDALFLSLYGQVLPVVLQPCQQLRSLTGWLCGDLTGSIDLSGSKFIAQNLNVGAIPSARATPFALSAMTGEGDSSLRCATHGVIHVKALPDFWIAAYNLLKRIIFNKDQQQSTYYR